MGFLRDATLYLGAAVLAVPIFQRLGLGSVLGYLTAGAILGPGILGLVQDPDQILHFAEIGVVLLLFVIGLELRPSRLWVLRRSVFGAGGLQVALTSVVLGGIAWGLGIELRGAVVLGLALALSSTAFVLQLLGEKGELATAHGRSAFGILLFQDLAVIPILAVVGTLGGSPATAGPWWRPLAILVALVVFVVLARSVLRPALRFVAQARVHEIFIAAALLLVLGAALLMEELGISMALGSFLAGVLLADSEYRHELEAAIDPFKGLLLGLFFLSVGMTLDIGQLLTNPFVPIVFAMGLMATKALLLFPLAVGLGGHPSPARRTALLLSQGGEFAFVILAAAGALELLPTAIVERTTLVVTVSMILTPLLTLIDEHVLVPWLDQPEGARPDETPPEESHDVIVAGFGRAGQVVARILKAKGIEFTALERDPNHLDFVRRFGNVVYFGDAAHLDLLRAAGADNAKLLVIAVNRAEDSVRIAEMAHRHFPNLEVYAAARNRRHALALREAGAKYVIRVTYGSSLELSEAVLEGLGEPPARAHRAVQIFREHDEATLDRQFEFHSDDDALIQSAKDAEEELKLLIESDEAVSDTTRRDSGRE